MAERVGRKRLPTLFVDHTPEAHATFELAEKPVEGAVAKHPIRFRATLPKRWFLQLTRFLTGRIRVGSGCGP